jgi:hypothetical protein
LKGHRTEKNYWPLCCGFELTAESTSEDKMVVQNFEVGKWYTSPFRDFPFYVVEVEGDKIIVETALNYLEASGISEAEQQQIFSVNRLRAECSEVTPLELDKYRMITRSRLELLDGNLSKVL